MSVLQGPASRSDGLAGSTSKPSGRSLSGLARAAALTPAQRSAIAKKAAAARWSGERVAGVVAARGSRGGVSEQAFHTHVAQFLALVLPREAWWTTFPAGGGGRIRGSILKGAGLKPGVPDILIVRGAVAYWIELKARRGAVSPAQIATMLALNAVGCQTAVCRSLDDVQSALLRWGFVLRGQVAA